MNRETGRETEPGKEAARPAGAGGSDPLPAQPQRIGAYPIVGLVGRGGMGVVYRAEDPRLKRQIALKILPEQFARDPVGLGRFEREAQLLAALPHPNIATIYSLEEAGGQHFLTMELVAGETLAERIDRGGLSTPEALSLCRQIAAALEATHKRDVIHGDLKPSNIKVTREGQVKVLDFGLARVLQRDPEETIPILDSASLFCGTPGYMSPEQLREEEIDPRADIWSFGCILFECLSGQRVFPGKSASDRIAATLERTPDWEAVTDEVSDRILGLLERCLTKNREDRLASMTEARQEIEEEIAQRSVSYDTPRPSARHRSVPNNLPLRLASFVGRKTQIADVKRLLTETRLLTLTGVGGCGKTRLAVEVGGELLRDFPDGVWLIELGPLSDGTRVPQALATALGQKEQPGRTLVETLIDCLQGEQVLLLLDGCEHLLAACAELTQTLLRADPELRVMATSREGLGIAGETIYQVPSLAVPPEKAEARRLEEWEAAELFADRARAASTDFELTKHNAEAVVQVCRRLDGIPLAIELAAARVRVLPVEEIARRLGDRFHLLTGGNKTALPRHQTLRALVDWSYNLLTAPEQALLRRLSVFSGGWTLDAAEEVCAGDGIAEWEVLDLHSRLVNKSLVEMRTSGRGRETKARYRMLETLREYGRDRLIEAGEVPVVRRRHRDFFLKLAEEAEPHLRGFQQTSWFIRLGREHANLRVAFDTCAEEESDPELGLRLAGALGRYWMVRGHWSEGRALCAIQLTRAGPGHRTIARAKTLNGAGNLAFHQGDYAEARTAHEEAREIRRELGDSFGEAMSLNNLGEVARMQGDYERANALYEESLATYRKLGAKWGMAVALNNLGEVSQTRGDYPRARRYHEDALAVWPELGDQWGMAWSLSNLGFVADKQGNLAEARDFYERGLETSRGLGDQFGIARSLDALGAVAARQKDYAPALAFHAESLMLRKDLGDRRGIVDSLEAFGMIAAERNQPERAARLLGAAEGQRESIHAALPSAAFAETELAATALRSALGPEAFDRLREEGRNLSLEQVVRYALETGSGPEAGPDVDPDGDPDRGARLDPAIPRTAETGAGREIDPGARPPGGSGAGPTSESGEGQDSGSE
jgi:predicted ATPase/serine/threonine protein kinase/Tfp pilus assembly protein PilF